MSTIYPISAYSLFRALPGGDPDLARKKEIVDGKYREEIRKFIHPRDMKVVNGGKFLQLPRKVIELPKFIRKTPQGRGVGSGEGGQGAKVGQMPGAKPGSGPGKGGKEAGQGAGEHIDEEWTPPIPRSLVAEQMEDIKDLVLPNLKPIGRENITEEDIKWVEISRQGGLMHKRATVKAAFKDAACEFGPDFEPEDLFMDKGCLRYHHYKIDEKPQANAAIIYMMDVSGSMGEQERDFVRTANFWLSTVIQHRFGQLNASLRGKEYTFDQFGKGVIEVFVHHDDGAREVTENDFYHSDESGGTRISSAFEEVKKIIHEGSKILQKKIDPKTWNLYLFYYGDGYNGGSDDDYLVKKLMKEDLLPYVNEIGFVQFNNYGKGDTIRVVENTFGHEHHIVRPFNASNPAPETYKRIIRTMLTERPKVKIGN